MGGVLILLGALVARALLALALSAVAYLRNPNRCDCVTWCDHNRKATR